MSAAGDSSPVLSCPHCGGGIQVLVDADAVDATVDAREALIDAVSAGISVWADAQQRMVVGMAVVKAPVGELIPC